MGEICKIIIQNTWQQQVCLHRDIDIFLWVVKNINHDIKYDCWHFYEKQMTMVNKWVKYVKSNSKCMETFICSIW